MFHLRDNLKQMVRVVSIPRTGVEQDDVNTKIGDYQITSANYDAMGMQIKGGEDAWAILTFNEYEGGANKPINAFTNRRYGNRSYWWNGSSTIEQW